MIWRLGVAGFPIEHSLSPTLHEAGLRLAHLEGSSQLVSLDHEQADQLRELMTTRFDALSVTMPLKAPAAQICDSLDAVASRLGVVNSLLVRDGMLLGASTDGQGFVDALHGQFGVSPKGMNVVVLGAGGAARGIIDALVHAGSSTIEVMGRGSANVEWLTSHYESVEAYTDGAGRVDLVVNTLPGHAREGEPQVVLGATPDTIAVDITYEPRHSSWRALYGELDCRTANGLGMLAYQAALQMQWWWERPIDGARLLEVLS